MTPADVKALYQAYRLFPFEGRWVICDGTAPNLGLVAIIYFEGDLTPALEWLAENAPRHEAPWPKPISLSYRTPAVAAQRPKIDLSALEL